MKRIRVGESGSATAAPTTLCCEATAHEKPWGLRIVAGTQIVDLSVGQWERLAERIRVEDVPEPKTPGQRLHESLLRAQVLTEMPWSECARVYKDRVERAAARLGIKPEGE